MALKKEDIAKLATLAKIPVADLEKAITEKEEVPLTVPEGVQTFLETELATLKKNQYDTGKVAGVEISVKEAREKLGLEFSGKTIDGLVEAATKKALADADKNPDTRIVELQKKLETVQKTAQTYEATIQEKDSAYKSLKDTFEIARHVPSPKEGGPKYTADQMIALAKMEGLEFKRNEAGVLVPYKNGEVMSDKLGNAIPAADAIKGFMKENNYISDEEDTQGGRGGKDRPGGGKVTKQSDIKARFIAEGKSLNGEEYAKAVEQAAAADPNFDASA